MSTPSTRGIPRAMSGLPLSRQAPAPVTDKHVEALYHRFAYLWSKGETLRFGPAPRIEEVYPHLQLILKSAERYRFDAHDFLRWVFHDPKRDVDLPYVLGWARHPVTINRYLKSTRTVEPAGFNPLLGLQ